MAIKKTMGLQPYPRREGEFLAADSMFPKSAPITDKKLNQAIKSAFDRILTKKKGLKKSTELSPEKLVQICMNHLKERSDPILSPSFLSQLELSDIFVMDAVSHEMQRHRMKIGEFYQFLVIELMKLSFRAVYDGKREGDVEAEVETPGFKPGIRLYISVKKSKDTVGGQDIEGVFRRLESLGKEDKNLTRPYMGIFAIATPPKGFVASFESSRAMRYKQDGSLYSPNIEEWLPGFLFPYICGRLPQEAYKAALQYVSIYLPFSSLRFKNECSALLVARLKQLDLIDNTNGRIDPAKFQNLLSSLDKK
jgi:hypothetical protein